MFIRIPRAGAHICNTENLHYFKILNIFVLYKLYNYMCVVYVKSFIQGQTLLIYYYILYVIKTDEFCISLGSILILYTIYIHIACCVSVCSMYRFTIWHTRTVISCRSLICIGRYTIRTILYTIS